MDKLVPSEPRINREALERIIHRAAELQTRERDLGEGLSELELLALGDEVGIPKKYLQQALLEESTNAEITVRGPLTWLLGPRKVSASRTIPRNKGEVEKALSHWMTEVELLAVKRRFPDGTSWEARKDVFASVRRAFSSGGRRYELSRAKEIRGRVTELDDATAHVTLVADLTDSRTKRLVAGLVLAGGGGAVAGTGVLLGFPLLLTANPIAVGLALGLAAGRSSRSEVEKIHVGLEQVHDTLERTEIDSSGGEERSAPGAILRIAEEAKKHLEEIKKHLKT